MQGHTGTYRDKQGHTGTFRDIQGHTGTYIPLSESEEYDI